MVLRCICDERHSPRPNYSIGPRGLGVTIVSWVIADNRLRRGHAARQGRGRQPMGHAHRDRGRTRSARRTRIIYTVATIVGVAFLLGLPLGTAAIGGTALQLNGSSQYATLGASSDLQSPTFTLELWFKRTGAGVGTTTGTGGIASAIPLITKARRKVRRRPPTSTTSSESTRRAASSLLISRRVRAARRRI